MTVYLSTFKTLPYMKYDFTILILKFFDAKQPKTAYRVCYACLTYGDEKKRVLQIAIALVVPEKSVHFSVCNQWRSKGGGSPRAAAKLRLYLKI